jgi:predicted metal-dependent hydrolase
VGEVTLSKTRRSVRIMLSVRPGGEVRLSFPMWVTQKRALKFLDEKVEWIAAAREKMAEKYPAERDRAGRSAPPTPDSAARKAAEKRALEAMRAEAKIKLPPMVARLAAEHGFRHGAVRIKATRSRWGSCTPRDDINLSLSLAALPDHLAEYIILHELCHTVHRNHSKRFHALLDRVTDGRSKALNAELRKYRPGSLI